MILYKMKARDKKTWFEYEVLSIHYIKWEIDHVICDFAENEWDVWEFKTSELEFMNK